MISTNIEVTKTNATGAEKELKECNEKSKKMKKWFIYDSPTETLVTYYGDYFRKVDFEIKPLLTKIFTEEFAKDTAGSKIKDPLVYALQLMDELNVAPVNPKVIAFFLKQQGMDLFNQPNVKGWNGGKTGRLEI